MTQAAARLYHTAQVHYISAPIAFNSGTISVGFLPRGAIVTGGGVMVNTAFAAGGANTMDVGFRNDGGGRTADPDAFATLLAVSAAGFKALDELAAATNLQHPAGCEVTATYNGTTPTDGAGVVVIQYIVP
jgi:hypothetical protein